jgi:hypothetical protein
VRVDFNVLSEFAQTVERLASYVRRCEDSECFVRHCNPEPAKDCRSARRILCRDPDAIKLTDPGPGGNRVPFFISGNRLSRIRPAVPGETLNGLNSNLAYSMIVGLNRSGTGFGLRSELGTIDSMIASRQEEGRKSKMSVELGIEF